MNEASITVDVYNPGQVFACLGFLEAADLLLGEAEGGFDWSDAASVCFRLRAPLGQDNPVESVLAFLAEAEVKRLGPTGYSDTPPKKRNVDGEEGNADEDDEAEFEAATIPSAIELTETFCARKGDRMTLPIRLAGGNRPVVDLGHWSDGSSRDSFKLYAGNRTAHSIACAMLKGVFDKPGKKQKAQGEPGELRSKGLVQLWEEARERLITDPFNELTPMGGSFNFDPRGAWTAIDAGYSPNDQGHQIEASPVVEILAAWGLEHARPPEFDTRRVRYAVWGIPLPPMLARAALCGGLSTVPLRHFRFALDLSGKNKVVTYSEETSK